MDLWPRFCGGLPQMALGREFGGGEGDGVQKGVGHL